MAVGEEMSHYAMERGWQEHPFFDGDEYSRRDAWEWLVANAAWKDTQQRIAGTMFDIQRGQLSHSIRFMAGKWKWHRAKVERFLNSLKTESMIETQTETGRLTITICNYDKYQIANEKRKTKSETKTETVARQQRDKEEEGKEDNINIISEIDARGPEFRKAWDAWAEMRKRIKHPLMPDTEAMALKKLKKFEAKGHDPTEILNTSTLSDWRDLYEPKEKYHATQRSNQQSPKPTHISESQRLAAKYRENAEREEQSAAGGDLGAGVRSAEDLRQITSRT